MDTTTIRTSEPSELLALIPFQLGFEPEESAVAVSIRAGRGRVGLVARVDLADLADPEQGPQLARSLVGHLVADGAREVVLVLYTAEDLQLEPTGTSGAAAHGHLADAAEHFVGDVTCWVVGPDGYYAAGCTDVACCPRGGRPHHDLQGTQVGAQMVLSGARVADSRAQLVAIAPASGPARRSARLASRRAVARQRAGEGSGAVHRWRTEALLLWRTEVDGAIRAASGTVVDGLAAGRGADRGRIPWTPPRPTVLGRLHAALTDVLVRDAVLLGFIEGTESIADQVITGDGGEGVGRALQVIIDPTHGEAPDLPRATGTSLLLEAVVAHATRSSQAPALTLLGVLAWWQGDGARAGVLVERALAADGSYRLAALIDEALAAGMPPGWLRAQAGTNASAPDGGVRRSPGR